MAAARRPAKKAAAKKASGRTSTTRRAPGARDASPASPAVKRRAVPAKPDASATSSATKPSRSTRATRRTSTTKRAPAKKAAAKKKPAPRKRAAAKAAAPPAAPPLTDADVFVLEQRRAGWTFLDMALDRAKADSARPLEAHLVDVTESWARAFGATEAPSPAAVASLELDRLERLLTGVWTAAARGDVAAVAQARGLLEARLKAAEMVGALAGSPDAAAGPVETATRSEVARLHMVDSPLAAAAVAMARLVDQRPGDSPAATTAARELRMQMTNLRNLVGYASRPGVGPDDAGKGPPGQNVVPPSRLAGLRERHEERRA